MFSMKDAAIQSINIAHTAYIHICIQTRNNFVFFIFASMICWWETFEGFETPTIYRSINYLPTTTTTVTNTIGERKKTKLVVLLRKFVFFLFTLSISYMLDEWMNEGKKKFVEWPTITRSFYLVVDFERVKFLFSKQSE